MKKEEKEVVTFSNLPPRNEWARKHLNWALILYTLVLAILSLAVFLPMVFLLPDDDSFLPIYSVGLGIVYGFALYLYVWNLKHKGRSLWNLLYLLIPQIGGIIFLCVRNRHQLEEGKIRERAINEMFKGRKDNADKSQS